MRLLVTGAGGMLGGAVVGAGEQAGHEVQAAVRAQLDVTDGAAVMATMRDGAFDAVVNCAAYTEVDGAEVDRARAQAVNAHAAGHVARAAASVGAFVVHVSTDYVFDGSKDAPWVESDPVGPLGVYGETKLAGERAVVEAAPEHAIVRTAWLFGAGGRNFVDTMLDLGRSREEVSVVVDQVGSPTWTGHLAGALIEIAERRDAGIHHVAGSGACSRLELAVEAFACGGVDCRVLPAAAGDFPLPAPRPAYSVLGTERLRPVLLPAWQDGVAAYLAGV